MLHRIAIVSDIHYAGPAEQARRCFDYQTIDNPILRWIAWGYRYFIWRRDPFAHNALLDRFLSEVDSPDCVVGNGDFSCDTAFIGVSDPAACESADHCISRLRSTFGDRFHATIGDHELGKTSLFGGHGGMRLASWDTTIQRLNLQPFWRLERGCYVILGVTSSLLALPVYEPETLADERPHWHDLREKHCREIRAAFAALQTGQRVILFCHDPTALPFLWRDPVVHSKLHQVERTIIGHLHSNLFLWNSRLLSGLPTIRFLGTSICRMSAALSQARCWNSFQLQLCPSLAGIQLLKDGGYYELELDSSGERPLKLEFRPMRWNGRK